MLGPIPHQETRDGPVDVSPTHDGQMVGYGRAVPGTAGAAVVGGGCSQMCNRDTPGRARRRGTGGLVGLGWCVAGERACAVWDVSRGAHNPEVAGSNPAPATNVVAGQRPFPGGRGLFLSSRVARCVAGFVKESPGIRD